MEYIEIKNILLKLQFNINSKGFNYWVQAIHLYTKFNEKITMTELYKQLAYEFMTNENCIERSLRTASIKSYKKIQEYFNYYNKITNRVILELFRIYNDNRKGV